MSYKINPVNNVLYLYRKSTCRYWNNAQKRWFAAETDPRDVPVPDLYVILVGSTLSD